MGRPPRFTQQDIGDAALAVLDDDGIAGVTVRAVAARLGAGAMTLYNYIDSHDDLPGLAVDAAIHDIHIPSVESADWRDDVRVIGHAVWSATRRHPNTVPLILARRYRSSRFLDIAEALLRTLARSGRSGHDLLVAFRAVSTLSTAFAQTEIGSALSTGNGERSSAEVIQAFASLDRERYGRLIEIAGAAETSDPETEFMRSLDALLDGLASQDQRTRS